MNWDKVEFKNEKRFLSNMFPCKIKFEENEFTKRFQEFTPDNQIYKSSEHLYQALKSKDPKWHEYIRGIERPEKTKTAARKLLSTQETLFDGEFSFIMRKDWDKIKLKAMEMILYLKFSQNPELLAKLKQIQGKIEERNCWNDTFWGTVDGKGKNHLGRLLMEVQKKTIKRGNRDYI